MRKTKSEAEKTRQHLLDAALEVFWRKGVTSASLQEIAEEAGVTRGALYWHFANKEALFEALFVRQQADFIAFFDERTLRESADVWEHTRQSLIAVCRAICEDARQYKFCSVMFLKCEQTESNRTITELVERYCRIFQTQIMQAMQLGQERGSLPAETYAAAAGIYLESCLVGLIKVWLDNPERFNLAEGAQRGLSACMASLQNGFLSQNG